MKRLALLFAGTAMPIALFAAPDFTSRAAAQSPPSIEMLLEEAGLDRQALERLERALAEAQDEASILNERAEERADRAATSAAQAEYAREDYEALADDPDADPDEIEAARADADEAAAQADEDAQGAAEAREAAEAAEAEVSEIRDRIETAEREAQEIRDRAAEAEREAGAAAEAEREAEERREAEAEEPATAPEPQNFGEVREGRRSRVEEGVTITEEPGARTIIEERARLIIRQAEDERVRRTYSDVRRERRGDQEILVAPRAGRNGDVEIITVLDTDGNLLRRIRRDADGTETVLIDNTRRERSERDRGDDRRADRRGDWRDEQRRSERRDGRGEGLRFDYDGGAFSFRIDIPPPVVRMPRDRYVVEYGDVYEDELAEIFSAPPVAEIHDRFTLDEVRDNPNLRDYMARVDLDTVTFDTGSWSLSPRQIDQLGRAARAMNRVIDENPDEIFLIEGHTDAIGRAIDNLSLSDRRAESVAYILTRIYDVPPENLVMQGYGEEFLKIDTQEAERRNRRVTIRRITPLIAQGPRG